MVVLNWNCAEDAIKCVDSLLRQSKKPDVIIVDNASSDDSVAVIKKFINEHKGEKIHFIQNTENSGYSGGNNVGFRYAMDKKYSYIGTLNPDAVVDKNWTKYLCAELDSSETGIATGILARSDKKTLDSTGDFYTVWGIPSPRGRNQPIESAPKKPEFVFGASGGGFIAKSKVFETVGLFDEKFFMYLEDVDLSFRTQLAGYKVRYTPKAIAYHKISASTDKVPGLGVKQHFKNLPILFVKNVPFGLWWRILPRFSLAYILILGHAIVKKRGRLAISGWLKSLLLLPHAFRSRYKIQKGRRVSSKYIYSIILHDIPPEQTGLRKFRDFFVGKSR